MFPFFFNSNPAYFSSDSQAEVQNLCLCMGTLFESHWVLLFCKLYLRFSIFLMVLLRLPLREKNLFGVNSLLYLSAFRQTHLPALCSAHLHDFSDLLKEIIEIGDVSVLVFSRIRIVSETFLVLQCRPGPKTSSLKTCYLQRIRAASF